MTRTDVGQIGQLLGLTGSAAARGYRPVTDKGGPHHAPHRVDPFPRTSRPRNPPHYGDSCAQRCDRPERCLELREVTYQHEVTETASATAFGVDTLVTALPPASPTQETGLIFGSDGVVAVDDRFRQLEHAWYQGLAAIARDGVGVIIDEVAGAHPHHPQAGKRISGPIALRAVAGG